MSLCLFYKKHSIRRKKVTRFKSAAPSKQAEYDVWQMESWNALQAAFRAKERVIYIDEVVFTKTTIPRLDYAPKYSNQTVDEKDFYSKYLAVIAAISADRGVDTILIYDQAVNRFDIIEFLKHLRSLNEDRRLHVFLDNLSAHKTPEVMEAFNQQNIAPIFNVPYRYDL